MRPANGSLNRCLFVAPFIIVLLAGLTGPALAQSAQQEQDNPLMKAFKEAQWTEGPATAQLGSIAEIKLPKDFGAVKGDDARRISEAMHNPTGGQEFSLIFPPSANWYLKFQFEEIGLVKDDEKSSLDPNAMLESIKQGTEAANKERAKRGWTPITVVGWEQPPHYDEQTHNLTWAIRGESRGETIINYDTRLLGRKGVMHVKLVTDPQTLPQAVSEFRTLLAGYNYTKGNRYTEWVQGDKVATVGLTALVTGGAAAVAVKSGLAKYLWKILLVVGAGFAAFFRKIFKRGTA